MGQPALVFPRLSSYPFSDLGGPGVPIVFYRKEAEHELFRFGLLPGKYLPATVALSEVFVNLVLFPTPPPHWLILFTSLLKCQGISSLCLWGFTHVIGFGMLLFCLCLFCVCVHGDGNSRGWFLVVSRVHGRS